MCVRRAILAFAERRKRGGADRVVLVGRAGVQGQKEPKAGKASDKRRTHASDSACDSKHTAERSAGCVNIPKIPSR